MYPCNDSRKAFKYPEGRQLRINGIVSKELLVNPDLLNDNDLPCLIVPKDGDTTDLTVGCATGLESFVRDDGTEEESTELAIYKYNKKPVLRRDYHGADHDVCLGYVTLCALIRLSCCIPFPSVLSIDHKLREHIARFQ